METPPFLRHSNTVFVIEADMEGRIIFVNQYLIQTLSGSSNKIPPTFIAELFSDGHRPLIENWFNEKQQEKFEIKLLLKSDSSQLTQWEFSYTDKADITGIGYLLQDEANDFLNPDIIPGFVNEQKLSESVFRGAFEYSPSGIAILSLDGSWLRVNNSFCNILGYAQQELLQLDFKSLTHPDDLGAGMLMLKKAMAAEIDNYSIEQRFFHKNGSSISICLALATVKDSRGKAVYYVMQVEDMTQRNKINAAHKLMEEQLVRQKVQEQKKITRAVLQAEEKERHYISQELHDNICQLLVGTRLYLNVAGNTNKKIKELLKYPMNLIDTSIGEIRLLSAKQVTPQRNINLEELIQTLLDPLNEQSEINCDFVYDVDSHLINDDDLKLNIYRIIQEQLTNILKHSNCRNMSISITTDASSIRINITDDGKGFNPELKRKGIGISNIMNRIESFNGEIKISSRPGHGCRTEIRIPV